jgi:hypothetical protein
VVSTTSIDNTGCTKPCTEQHEAQHVSDYTNWGCCKKLHERKDSADFTSHKAAYARWSDTVRPISECRAYKVDVKCATKKTAELQCGTPKQKPENAAAARISRTTSCGTAVPEPGRRVVREGAGDGATVPAFI